MKKPSGVDPGWDYFNHFAGIRYFVLKQDVKKIQILGTEGKKTEGYRLKCPNLQFSIN